MEDWGRLPTGWFCSFRPNLAIQQSGEVSFTTVDAKSVHNRNWFWQDRQVDPDQGAGAADRGARRR
jgi:hypothetical protein